MIHCKGCRQHQQSHGLGPSTEPSRAGAQISHLVVQAGLLYRRNQDHSPIYTLPPEVLTAIFLLRCTPKGASWEKFGKPTRQVAILSSVSSYWRQVVSETPGLWNTVTLVVRRHSSRAKVALLQHHLIHTKNTDVSLVFLKRTSVPTGDIEYEIFKMLFAPENAQKVTTLRVRYLPVGWSAELSQLPRLHTLVLENMRGEGAWTPAILDFHTQPLHRFSLSFDDFEPYEGLFKFPSSVQEVLTNRIPFSRLVEFPRQCPNMTKFIGANPRAMDTSFFTTPLTLGRLETLTLPARPLDLTSVQNLSLPTLKHLRLEDGFGLNAHMPIIIFCHQLSETLTSLELHLFHVWKPQDLQRLFLHGLEHLEILKLIDWPLRGWVVATRILTPSAEEFRHNSLPALPSLRYLVVRASNQITSDSSDDRDNDGSDSDLAAVSGVIPSTADNMVFLFLDLLKKRRAGETTPFCLDLPELWLGDKKLKWSDKRRVFKDVIAGRSVELLQGGKVLRL